MHLIPLLDFKKSNGIHIEIWRAQTSTSSSNCSLSQYHYALQNIDSCQSCFCQNKKKNMQEAFWEVELQQEQQSFRSMDAKHMQNVWCNQLRGYLINIDDGTEPDPICDYLESMRFAVTFPNKLSSELDKTPWAIVNSDFPLPAYDEPQLVSDSIIPILPVVPRVKS